MATRRMSGKPAKATKKGGGKALWLLVPLAIAVLPTLMLLVPALLPTFVAAFIDRNPKRHAGYCVGGFNLAATMPALIDLWFRGQTVAAVKTILLEPMTWLAAYGGAAIGWGFYWLLPQIVTRVQAWRDDRRRDGWVARRASLVGEWGEALVEAASSMNAPPKPKQG